MAGDLDYSVSFCGYVTGVQAPASRVVATPVVEFTPDTVKNLQDLVAAKTC